MQLRIAAEIGTGDIIFELPERGDRDAADRFDEICDAIRVEYERRIGSEGKNRGGAYNWLTPVAYELISHMIINHLKYIVVNRAAKCANSAEYVPEQSNIFAFGLFTLLSSTQGNDRQRRGELANGLMLAFRHYVPLCFLDSFIKAYGLKARASRLMNIRPEFYDWIVERRVVSFEGNAARGEYPPEIERRVADLRLKGAGVMGPILQAAAEAGREDDDEDDNLVRRIFDRESSEINEW